MERVDVTANWDQSGCELNKAVLFEITHEDVFIRPELDTILSEERAVLLTRPSQTDSSVVVPELQIQVQPHYKIEALHCVCSVPKIEVFLRAQKEYAETLYGTLIEDSSDEDNTVPSLLSYRYDIEVQKSGIVELTLKLLTNVDEVCIFGMFLQAAPNPNGITTLQGTSINLDKVQQMLDRSSQKLSPNAENCKLFVEMYNKHNIKPITGINETPETPPALLEQMKHIFTSKLQSSHTSHPQKAPSTYIDSQELKNYIELQLKQMEARLTTRIDAFEAQQTVKLDSIYKLLEEYKK